jgi:hypothetical protein
MEVFRALDKSDFSSMPAKMTFILQWIEQLPEWKTIITQKMVRR